MVSNPETDYLEKDTTNLSLHQENVDTDLLLSAFIIDLFD